MVERTAGEVSARCHDEQANNLALNLMHDILTEARSVDDARTYYAQEFLGYRRKDRPRSWRSCGSSPRAAEPPTPTNGS